MNKQENNKMLIAEIKKKLDWYISEASDEEYDEKVVESLQYLLDKLEPIDKSVMPNVDEAWARFQELVKEKDRSNKAASKKKATSAKVVTFVSRHKAIVAAVFLVLVLAVGMGTQTEAVRNNGFFHWLKNDETGMQMVTSPDGLDGVTEVAEKKVFYDREEIPDWAKEWAEIEKKVMEGEGYEWEYVEVKEYQNRSIVGSQYKKEGLGITVGAMFYAEKVTVSTEMFDEYKFVEMMNLGKVRIAIYEKDEDNEKKYYIVNFSERNYCYYVLGEDLVKVKEIVKKYQEALGKLELKK